MTDTAAPTPDTPERPSRDYGRILVRALLMAVFVVMISVATYLVTLIAVIQVVWMLISGQSNPRLSAFGASIGRWLEAATRFQTVSSEDKPFPWQGWPDPR